MNRTIHSKTVDVRQSQGLIQSEVNGLLLAVINGDVRRVKVHAVEIVEDWGLAVRSNRANDLFPP